MATRTCMRCGAEMLIEKHPRFWNFRCTKCKHAYVKAFTRKGFG